MNKSLAIAAVALLLTASPAHANAPDPAARLLAAHNAERIRVGQPPLVWSAKLAEQARAWAATLAARGAFQHAPNPRGAGENLWIGTSGFFTPEQMVGSFINERRHFQAGRFPQVSRTGRWWDVGHYTQLIWPTTRELGCAIAKGRGRDVLVCRYFPAGNMIGAQVP